MKPLFTRTDQSAVGQWWWTVDRPMLAAFIGLIVFGLVLVSAASPPVAVRVGLNEYHFVIRHIIFLVPSIVILFAMSFLSPRNLWRVSSLILLAMIGCLVFVLAFGTEIKGAQRWIHVLGFSLQPSEIVKPTFAVVSAWLIAKQREKNSRHGSYIALGLYAVIVALLLMQPDLGMTVVVSCIFGAVVFLAGFPFWLVGVMMVMGAGGLLASYFAFSHVKSRIDRFLDPSSGDNYQVQKALEAFQNGGIFGTGPGQGTVKLSLPDSHADFIFAVSGEELGLIVSAVLVILFVFILFRGLNRIMDCDDLFIVLATGGLLTMFGMQSFIHMASSLSLIPTKGMTLPFISYGGSSLLSVAMAAGMILSLTRVKGKSAIAKGSAVSRRKVKESTANVRP